MIWECVIEKAIRDDGSLFFPEKLTHEFLEQMRRSLGSYIFANQYLNEVLPADRMVFKREWVKYYDTLPQRRNTFIFIDPALSESEGSDNTGLVVVHVDEANRWYVEVAQRKRLRPTEIVALLFDLNTIFKPTVIGIEDVAFQKALLHFAHEEMKRRGVILPLHGVNPGVEKTKEMRILSLVPRFEWDSIFLNRGLVDLEDELFKFPRAAHDDVIDSLSSINFIAYAPQPMRLKDGPPRTQNAESYEQWYRRQLTKGKNPREESYGPESN